MDGSGAVQARHSDVADIRERATFRFGLNPFRTRDNKIRIFGVLAVIAAIFGAIFSVFGF
jgi:hypothetical protein